VEGDVSFAYSLWGQAERGCLSKLLVVYRETKVIGKYEGLLCGRNENGLVKGGCHLVSLDVKFGAGVEEITLPMNTSPISQHQRKMAKSVSYKIYLESKST